MIRDPYSWGGSTYPAYDGFLKGDSTAKASEQQSLQFQQQLMAVFQQQFAQQSSVLKFLTTKLKPMITNPTGFSAATLASMNTRATQQAAIDYQNATRAVQNREAAVGGFGTGLPSGVNAQIGGQIATSASNELANEKNQIQLADEQTKQNNFWNATKALSGAAETMNPVSYASATNQSAGTVANLSNAYSNSQSAGFFNRMMDSAGSALGNVLGGGNASQSGGWLGMG